MTGRPAPQLPVIDMAPLFQRDETAARARVAREIEAACRASGFFYVTGHGVSDSIIAALDTAARRFFALPEATKMEVAMAKGGRAWRGFFPLGDELTSGRPDGKEGIYFGIELPADHPRVEAGWPLHGPNLWPAAVPELRPAVQGYMTATARAAHHLLEGVALSLGLEADYFEAHYTAEPTVLFRIFHYPPTPPSIDGQENWGVGEHSDYGLLTLLAQDEHGGLQVKTPEGWIAAPPLPGTLVCNIGDMLDRLTEGRYRSTPHRVRNLSGRSRLSFPLFFDPAWDAVVTPLPLDDTPPADDAERRWDGTSVHAWDGTYGDYLSAKVARVFPDLFADVTAAGG